MWPASGFLRRRPREPMSSRDFHDHIAARLHLLPFFERRLNAIPASVDNPVWIHEANVDLDYHIRQMALPRPGSMEQLRTLVARLHMILLDRSRPLWQYYVIEGLEGGGFAVYVKMHHSGIDGGAGMAALDIIFGASPEPVPVAPPPVKSGAAEPTLLELVGKTYEDFWAQQRRMLEALPDMGKALANVGRRLIEDLGRPNTVTLAPKTIFNVAVSKQRSFGTTTIPLSEVKAIGSATGSKVNDVVMAVCAGALRRYLLERSALPKESLIAALPVSLREPGNTDMNNQVTMMLCSLSTDIADPLPRLAAIVASSQDSKARLGDVKGAMPIRHFHSRRAVCDDGACGVDGTHQGGRSDAGHGERADFQCARTAQADVLRRRAAGALFPGVDSIAWRRIEYHRAELHG